MCIFISTFLFTYICAYINISTLIATSEWINLSEAVSAAQVVAEEADSILSVFKELKTTCDSSLLANGDKDKGIHMFIYVYLYLCVHTHIWLYIYVRICKHEYISVYLHTYIYLDMKYMH
jgi:hypothetical protein